MSKEFGKKWSNIDQPAGNSTLLVGGASLALASTSKGVDVITDTSIVQVTSGQFPSPTETLSESITQLTVV